MTCAPLTTPTIPRLGRDRSSFDREGDTTFVGIAPADGRCDDHELVVARAEPVPGGTAAGDAECVSPRQHVADAHEGADAGYRRGRDRAAAARAASAAGRSSLPSTRPATTVRTAGSTSEGEASARELAPVISRLRPGGNAIDHGTRRVVPCRTRTRSTPSSAAGARGRSGTFADTDDLLLCPGRRRSALAPRDELDVGLICCSGSIVRSSRCRARRSQGHDVARRRRSGASRAECNGRAGRRRARRRKPRPGRLHPAPPRGHAGAACGGDERLLRARQR